MVCDYDLLHLLHRIGAPDGGRTGVLQRRYENDARTDDGTIRTGVNVYDLLPHQPGRDENARTWFRVWNSNGGALRAKAPTSTTAPATGAYVGVWRAWVVTGNSTTPTIYVGATVFTPDEERDSMTVNDELVAPARDGLWGTYDPERMKTYSPEIIPTPVRATINRALYETWFDGVQIQRRPRARYVQQTNANTVTIVGAQ